MGLFIWDYITHIELVKLIPSLTQYSGIENHTMTWPRNGIGENDDLPWDGTMLSAGLVNDQPRGCGPEWCLPPTDIDPFLSISHLRLIHGQCHRSPHQDLQIEVTTN